MSETIKKPMSGKVLLILLCILCMGVSRDIPMQGKSNKYDYIIHPKHERHEQDYAKIAERIRRRYYSDKRISPRQIVKVMPRTRMELEYLYKKYNPEKICWLEPSSPKCDSQFFNILVSLCIKYGEKNRKCYVSYLNQYRFFRTEDIYSDEMDPADFFAIWDLSLLHMEWFWDYYDSLNDEDKINFEDFMNISDFKKWRESHKP